MPRLPLTTLACLALALGGAFVAGCGGDDDKGSDSSAQSQSPDAQPGANSSGGTGGTSASEETTVEMEGSKFVPEAISVAVGQQITWSNKDGYAHNVTSTAGEKINSGNIDGEGTFEFTPKQAGTIAYTCTLHTDQDGKITVTR